MTPSTLAQPPSTRRESRSEDSSSSPRRPPTRSGTEPGAGREANPGREPRLPRRIAPFDYGDGKDEIARALELNRQLLLAAQEEPLVDEPAVRAKINELLGRLLALG